MIPGGSRSVRLVSCAVLLGGAARASAEPQASLGVTAGAAAQSVSGSAALSPGFDLGGRADVLFLRERNGQMALGPYVSGGTLAFRTVDLGGGAEWLIPMTPDIPLVVSGGPFARGGDRPWAPGLAGGLFVGSRSFNFHSWYGLAAGVFATSRWVPASPSSVEVVLGVQVDAELLALPALFVWRALGGA